MSFQNYRNYGGGEGDKIQHQEWKRYSANKQKWRMCPRLAMPLEENYQIIRERIFEEQIHQQFWTQSFGQPFSNQSTIGRRRMILSSLRELPIGHHRQEHFPTQIYSPPPPKCHFIPPKYHIPPRPPQKSNFEPHQQEVDGQIHQENRKNVQIEQNHRPKRELLTDNNRSAANLQSPIFKASTTKCHFIPPPPPTPSEGNFVPNLEEDGQIHQENQENGENVQIEQQIHQISKNGRMETEDGREEAKNVDPDNEIMNEQEGFQIRVEAKGFTDSDFKVSINSFTKILALDGEHFEENNENGTMTIKKLNRQWKLADNIDLHSVLAFFTADGNVEIMGEKKKLEENDKEDEHLEEGIMNNNEAMAKEDDNDEEEQLEMATAAVMASIKTI